MGKRAKQGANEFGDEFFAQLDFLRTDYDRISEELEHTKSDARKLMALLVENDIPVPQNLLARYIRKAPENDNELPFD